jgi:hypothetical protein
VLGFATFAAVRSSNRSARIAERALAIGLRPMLVPARKGDPLQLSRWLDAHRVFLVPGRVHLSVEGDVIYMAFSLRNAGQGIAVLSGWFLHHVYDPRRPAAAIGDFQRLGRDLYVPSGDVGFWQSAIRDRSDPRWQPLASAIERQEQIGLELLYGDHEGGQPTITRFVFFHEPDEEHPDNEPWRVDVVRHWRPDDGDVRIL